MAASRLFVIAAPSGAGKTSLVNALLASEPGLRASVSHTTRLSRPHEQNGREYFFVSVAEFQQLLAANAFLEHAQVFDNFYGTSLAQLHEKMAAGHDVILEIDWQGAKQVRQAIPDCISVFILPPSRATLEQRLRSRKTDSEAVITRRLRDAVCDMGHAREFDFVIVNDHFESAVNELRSIVKSQPLAEQLRADRTALRPLLADLLV